MVPNHDWDDAENLNRILHDYLFRNPLRFLRYADKEHRPACAGEDPAYFFPASRGRYNVSDVNAAKNICARCPLIAGCQDWALEQRDLHGIWGGLTRSERDQIKERRHSRRAEV